MSVVKISFPKPTTVYFCILGTPTYYLSLRLLKQQWRPIMSGSPGPYQKQATADYEGIQCLFKATRQQWLKHTRTAGGRNPTDLFCSLNMLLHESGMFLLLQERLCSTSSWKPKSIETNRASTLQLVYKQAGEHAGISRAKPYTPPVHTEDSISGLLNDASN